MSLKAREEYVPVEGLLHKVDRLRVEVPVLSGGEEMLIFDMATEPLHHTLTDLTAREAHVCHTVHQCHLLLLLYIHILLFLNFLLHLFHLLHNWLFHPAQQDFGSILEICPKHPNKGEIYSRINVKRKKIMF